MANSDVLTLGWAVNDALEPLVARRGLDAPRITVPTACLDKHTAIVAQSGSGKSFFLGRYIEEIALRTKARCVVLDPNGDFVRLGEVDKTTPWGSVVYDFDKRRGRITQESNANDFTVEWNAIQKRIRSAPLMSSILGADPLVVHWTDVSAGLVAPDFDRARVHEVTDCHRIVQAFCKLYTAAGKDPARDLLNMAEELLLSGGTSDISARLKSDFNLESIAEMVVAKRLTSHGLRRVTASVNKFLKDSVEEDLHASFSTICHLDRHIQSDAKRYYFSKASSLSHDKVFSISAGKPDHQSNYRVDVVDLSSISDDSTRLLVTNAILRQEWEGAVSRWREAISPIGPEKDTRVPTFIIVDEAHNFIPIEPRGAGAAFVREQLRAIAAEGRKYGVFLVVVSQRPDKLDHLVISECENKVLMRISSETVLRNARTLLGLEDIPSKTLRRAIEFTTGRGLLAGHWTEGSYKLFYSQARRTKEGGKNLDSDYWSCNPAASPATKPAKLLTRKKKGTR